MLVRRAVKAQQQRPIDCAPLITPHCQCPEKLRAGLHLSRVAWLPPEVRTGLGRGGVGGRRGHSAPQHAEAGCVEATPHLCRPLGVTLLGYQHVVPTIPCRGSASRCGHSAPQ